MSELNAAGITDPQLRASYSECKRLNSLHGKTYYLATLLLPASKRPFVHALYGFARYADEIVDDLASTLSAQEKAEVLRAWSSDVLRGLETGESSDLVGRALIDTVQRFDIPHQHFVDFLHSMEMDLTVTEYQTFDDLYEYVYGSAAVIGLQMVPILGGDTVNSLEAAKNLGVAFQLANFIRDVGEDLDRGRVYLPLQELAEHGVTRQMLEARKLTPEIVSALKFQIARVRQLQKAAEPGIALLDKTSQPCIRAASELYCGIVDEVEKIGYDIFNKRATTSTARRARVALAAYISAVAARLR
ncbi:MAG: phytoene/squalene synthase family protein [Candidatus Planktophila sp.]|nr:phytoene/squalene synthase family protein [Candidatus Planktophila sp.]